MFKGLNKLEIKLALDKYGLNELPSVKPKNFRQITIEVIREPMFLIIIACSVLYMLLGDYKEGIIMFATVSIIISITFYQYRKTEKALEALRKLSLPFVQVIRDNIEVKINASELLPGDIMIINEGDRICADCNLLETAQLEIDESLITGESSPVMKDALSDNKLFSGTLVVKGSGLVLVTATGKNAFLGKIAGSLQNIKTDESRLQKEMKKLIFRLSLIAVLICIAIILLYIFSGKGILQSILNGLSAAMAILPEEFPVVMTIFLVLGSWRLSVQNVLTRKPSAIETLGSATVLCSDKTGTITQNKMGLKAIYNGDELIYLNEFKDKSALIEPMLKISCHATSVNSIDPMEKAIHKLYLTLFDNSPEASLIKEYPFNREMMIMTRVFDTGQTSPLIASKGAPEAIFSFCDLDPEQSSKYKTILHSLAQEGLRVIGLALGKNNSAVLPDSQRHFDFQFLGFLAFEDPVRPEVPAAVQDCYRAGIEVKMITGDYPETARSIAAQIGLKKEKKLLTGKELDSMSDVNLNEKITEFNIFARITPEQKLRIVNALKSKDEIVAMTGDGVNDAPALKAADIGIAMGKKGTEVAREASSLVLLDDNFASIVNAIRLGRRIFDNIQKAMSYILAIHIPIIGLSILPALMSSFPLFLYPLHIIFMELIIDPICSVAFETEIEEKNIMLRAARPKNESFFGIKQILRSVMDGLLLLIMVLAVYFYNLNQGFTENELRAQVYSTLVIGNLFLILSKLSKTRSFLSVFTQKNYMAVYILATALTLLLLMVFNNSVNKIFRFENPGIISFTPTIVASLILLFIYEFLKLLQNKSLAK